MDYWDIVDLDWSLVKLPIGAPCPHGLSGAVYCVQCMMPILAEARQEQLRLRAEEDAEETKGTL